MGRDELRRYVAEFVGTAFLLAGIVGSGIMAETLSADPGLRLLQNAVATGAVLVAVILAVGPVSGAHVNPVVTIADRIFGGMSTREAVGYVIAQLSGGFTGVVLANLMFGLSAVETSGQARRGGDLWLAEAVATAGLLVVIFGVVRSGRESIVAFAVGGYITAAFYFTSSTSFANPAVTAGRMFSDTFAGIDPSSAAPFVGAQLVGLAAAVLLIRFLYPTIGNVAGRVLVTHESDAGD